MVAALCTCLALVAVGAGAAQAQWTIEGTKFINSEEVSVSGGPLTFTGEVLGTKIEFEVGSIECSAGLGCTIDNSSATTDHIVAFLTLTTVKVTKPANCTVYSSGSPAGTITSYPLIGKAIMDPKAGSTAVFAEFAGEIANTLAEFEFGNPLCPLWQLTFTVEGTLMGEMVHTVGTELDIPNKTGELFVDQSLTFNQAMQETGGGLMYAGGNKKHPAFLAGTVHSKLSGANAGKKFGAD